MRRLAAISLLLLEFASSTLASVDADSLRVKVELSTSTEGLAVNLKKDQQAGTAFRLVDLPPEHPALDFARTVNPRFGQDFPTKLKPQ